MLVFAVTWQKLHVSLGDQIAHATWSLAGTQDSSSPTQYVPLWSVKRTSPDTAIHEQNGYAKLLDHKYNILMTNVDNDNSDTTYTNMREV